MYPSGAWEGEWHQPAFGRQPMTGFRLRFADGRVAGDGRDVVGRFTVAGEYDPASGRITFVKQYLGKHRVAYVGRPDGEGSIAGTWSIGPDWTGPFVLRPVVRRPSEDDPIQEIG